MFRTRIAALLAVAAAAPAFAQAGRAFTYQGQLKENGRAVTGTYDISASLFSGSSGGSALGAVCLDNVSVTNGIFTVEMDFGAAAFDGNDRFIQISVRADTTPGNCGGAGFTTLSGRQRVSPTPYALRTINNPSALDASDGSPVNALRVGPTGAVGIGTSNPNYPLSIRSLEEGLNGRLFSLRNSNDNERWIISLNNNNLTFNDISGDRVVFGNSSASALTVNGTARTRMLEITGGSDIAEPYNITGDAPIEPGMVVCIDPARVGELRVATSAYDTTVAGIVSGANGVNTGLTLTQKDSIADGKHPVALTGRVWCRCDASTGAIKPGDLLTTSATPGHAMKASDTTRTNGAVLGKAMSSLESGTGMVLVLVNLQ